MSKLTKIKTKLIIHKLNLSKMYAVIKSNSGNHSGFNRTWELMGVYGRIGEAHGVLFELALGASDDCMLEDEGGAVVIDMNGGEEVCRMGDDLFFYDGRTYMVIEEKDLDLFNGGSYGYLPQDIIDLFN